MDHRGTAGAALGTAMMAAAGAVLLLAAREPQRSRAAALAALGSATATVGVIALRAAPLREPVARSVAAAAAASGAAPVLLDTSALIDGRIAVVCETGFVEGPLVVPRFVLRELQGIADSADPVKRNRGRRGLEVVARLQKRPENAIRLDDRDYPIPRDVDGKLVALARETGARIVTNDVNLGKLAEVDGVPILNMNQLATALRPAVLPGETLRVTVLKEGKEPNQGVGYLDDGTMVVVDNARRHVGRQLEVSVTSSIQTSAGRMIFAQLATRESGPGPEGAA